MNFQSGQEYTFRFGNGTYLTAEPNGTFRLNANQVGDWEKFRLHSEGNNLFSIRSVHNKVVCFDQGKHSFDTRDNVGDWEKWEFRPAGNGAFHMYCPGQKIYINFDNNTARPAPDQYQASHVWITSPNQPQGYPPQQQQGYPQQQQYGGQQMNISQSVNLQSGQEYTLRFPNGAYLTAEPNGTFRVNANQVGDWEKFRFNNEGNNRWSLRTAHGKVVCFDQGKKCFDVRDNAGDWEKFEFRPSGNGTFHMFNHPLGIFIAVNNGQAQEVREHHHASHIAITPANGQQQPQYGGQQQQYGQQPQYGGQQQQYGQQQQQQQPIQGQIYPGFYFIRNHHGRFIEATRERFNQAIQAGHKERFYIEGLPGGQTFAIRAPSEHNHVLCVGGAGHLEYRDHVGGDWEKFEIRAVPGRPHRFNIYCPGQRKFLRCDSNAFDAVNFSESPGDWEQFEFLPTH